jgi:hypothetical protein
MSFLVSKRGGEKQTTDDLFLVIFRIIGSPLERLRGGIPKRKEGKESRAVCVRLL